MNYFMQITKILIILQYVNDSYINPTYYAYGILIQNKEKQNQYFTIYVDQSTMSFSLEPITQPRYEELIEGEKTNQEKSIERTNYNEFVQINLSQEEIARKYLEDYTYYALNDVQTSYKKIDKEYSKAKYGTLEKYEQYIKLKQPQLEALDYHSIKTINDFKTEEEYNEYINNLTRNGMKQYLISEKGDSTQCICIDSYDNYYIFNITSPMQYTVILDTYTIDLPEFTEQYNNSTNEKKVQLNISKFFAAINNSDYEYAYSKLDETYKQNNFATLESFENYIKQNFFEQNKVSVGNAQKQNDIYLYDATIEDASGKSSKRITKTFVMQLKEGTDFVMSFSAN